jgi:peptide/nickel transport system substrate-binding protein
MLPTVEIFGEGVGSVKPKVVGRYALVGIAALLLVLASGCPRARPAEPGEEVVLRMAIAVDESSLNPYTYVSGYPGHNLLLMIFDSLFQIDENNIPRPWLVKSYEVDATGLQWSFTLHEGITWTDGQPLTAHDVKFTFEYYQQHRHARWTRQAKGLKIDVQDTHRFQVTLPAPNAAFNIVLADLPIIPRHIWEGVTDPRNFHNNTGSGPYIVAEHVPDRSYLLRANPTYFKGEPKVDEIRIVIIEDATATFTALKAGEIDMATRSLTPELVPVFAGFPEVEVVSGAGFASRILLINNERPPFDDLRVRQAISLAIDPAELTEVVLLGYGVPGVPGFIHPRLPGYNPNVRHVTDRTRAQQLLQRAGAAGTPVELLARAGRPDEIRAAELIAGWLNDVGMPVEVKVLDSTTVQTLVWPGFDVTQGRDFDLAVFGWSAPVMIDITRVGTIFHSDLGARGPLNLGAYVNPAADAIIDQLVIELDPSRQIELLRELQTIVAATAPLVPLYYPDGIFAYRPAAYDGWVFTSGQGILSKISFVAPKW